MKTTMQPELDRTTHDARARTRHVAEHGVTAGKDNQRISKTNAALIQLRACRALLMDRDEILSTTGWSLQFYMALEVRLDEQDRATFKKPDPHAIFAEYREQQLQCAKELGTFIEAYRETGKVSAFVQAVKARSEILDRILRTGQELGVISRAAKEIRLSGKVDVSSATAEELKALIATEVDGLKAMISEGTKDTPADAVLARLQKSNAIDAEFEEVDQVRVPRVRRLKETVSR